MRDFSKVAPNVWKSRKYWQLPDDAARYCYHYLLTNAHVNSAGCYDLPMSYGTADMRWQIEAYTKAIDSMQKVGLIEFDEAENTVRVVNWMTFNEPTNPKHALGILIQLNQASSSSLKRNQFKEFEDVVKKRGFHRDKALAEAMRVFFEAYGKPITTETEIKTEIETEIERRPRGDLDRDAQARAPDVACASNGAAPPAGQDKASEASGVAHLLETNLMRRTA